MCEFTYHAGNAHADGGEVDEKIHVVDLKYLLQLMPCERRYSSTWVRVTFASSRTMRLEPSRMLTVDILDIPELLEL